MISALLFSLVAASAPASSPSDGWLAWQGCWRAYGDEDPSSLLCIIPEGEGARMVTVANGSIRGEMRIFTDGSARPFELEGCKGTQRAVWSSDQQRLFVNSSMTCGEALPRTVSGIMTMHSRTNWTNVEAVATGSLTSTRVVRYAAVETGEIPEEIAAPLRANRLARETARFNATADVDLDDVQEAVRYANESAVTTWLTEMNQPFELNGKKLVALADAGVPPAVIDVMVAVSNPEHFAVATQPTRIDDDYRRARRARAIGSCYDPFYDPWFGPLSYGYGYNSCYGYGGHFAPYGSGWNYGYGLPPIIVVRNPENPRAKVTRAGYTKGEPSTASPTPTRTSTSGSSGTTDSGSSSSSTGRTAKPRDN